MEVDPGSGAGTAVDRFLDEPLPRGLNGETAVDSFLDEPSDRGPAGETAVCASGGGMAEDSSPTAFRQWRNYTATPSAPRETLQGYLSGDTPAPANPSTVGFFPPSTPIAESDITDTPHARAVAAITDTPRSFLGPDSFSAALAAGRRKLHPDFQVTGEKTATWCGIDVEIWKEEIWSWWNGSWWQLSGPKPMYNAYDPNLHRWKGYYGRTLHCVEYLRRLPDDPWNHLKRFLDKFVNRPVLVGESFYVLGGEAGWVRLCAALNDSYSTCLRWSLPSLRHCTPSELERLRKRMSRIEEC